jgi:hypothetical protein
MPLPVIVVAVSILEAPRTLRDLLPVRLHESALVYAYPLPLSHMLHVAQANADLHLCTFNRHSGWFQKVSFRMDTFACGPKRDPLMVPCITSLRQNRLARMSIDKNAVRAR